MKTNYKGFTIETKHEDGKTSYVIKKGGRTLEEGQPCIQDESEAIEDGKEVVEGFIEENYPGGEEEHDDTPSLNDTFDHARNQ